VSVSLPILQSEEALSARTPPAAPQHAPGPGRLVDAHGRTVRDLRLSVTDRCNYRCVYCMDPGFRYMRKRYLLSRAEYVTVARVCAGLGIEKVRITGGEPTLYPELDDLIAELGALPIADLAMTTNGSLLESAALQRWRRHGLRRITLSLDSLRPERVAGITRTTATPERVIEAIGIARDAGFDRIKVNAVVIRGFNDDEMADFADLAREHGVIVRLVEFMPLDSSRGWSRASVVPADEMVRAIGRRHALVPLRPEDPSSTSMGFAFADGAPGGIGIIASVTQPFCGACSRLRLTADGKVRPCLFSHHEWDLRPLLRNGASDGDVARFLADATWAKQADHGIGSAAFVQPPRTMSSIGG
jgi:cyclic pyranopterin phosphate synthase